MNSQSFLTPILVGAVVSAAAVVALLLTTKIVGPLPFAVNQTVTQKQSTFDVQGESEIVTIPDVAEISLGIEIRKPTISAAQTDANTVINTVKERVQALGIDSKDIKTENYSVYPEYDYTSANRRVIGYMVNTSLRVSVKDFEVVNQVIDQATQAGVNQVSGISLKLSPEKEDEVKKQARQEAIAKAQQNASELAGLAGMKLGRIVNVYESQVDVLSPLMKGPANFDAVQVEGRGETEIEAGSTTYQYGVTLSYETY